MTLNLTGYGLFQQPSIELYNLVAILADPKYKVRSWLNLKLRLFEAFGDFTPSGPSTPSETSSWRSSASGSPTLYSDPFLRGEDPLEVNAFGESGQPNQQAVAERKVTNPGTPKPLPYLPRHIRQKVLFDFCVFCKNNGEDERYNLWPFPSLVEWSMLWELILIQVKVESFSLLIRSAPFRWLLEISLLCRVP